MPPKILVCLDTDLQPSVFDGVVAVDAGVDHLFRHGGITPGDIEGLVHGAMFTRGGESLKHTAIFVGGSDVHAGEELMAAAQKTFFGPVRVSLMLDSNGSNTTAAAAVVAARRHLPYGPEVTATVLGTGPVGQRVARMLAQEGVEVRVASRRLPKAEGVCHRIAKAVPDARVTPHATEGAEITSVIEGAHLLISAGPAGVELVSDQQRQSLSSLQVVVDLNAVPPLGVGGIKVTDKAADRDGQIGYGALGAGGLKMKIHKAAIARLFESNDLVLDVDEIYALGKEIASRDDSAR